MRTQIVVGTRSEALKMAPLVNLLKNTPHIKMKVCVTAPHCQMQDSMLDFFCVQPDYDLDVMAPNQTLLGMTSNALTGHDKVLNDTRPEFVLVPGDASTTLPATIVSESTCLLDDAATCVAMARAANPNGDGTASHAFAIFW